MTEQLRHNLLTVSSAFLPGPPHQTSIRADVKIDLLRLPGTHSAWFSVGLMCKVALRSVFRIPSCLRKQKTKHQVENTVLSLPDLLSAAYFKTTETSNFSKITNTSCFWNTAPFIPSCCAFSFTVSPTSFVAITRDLWPSRVSRGPHASLPVLAKLILDYEVDFFICFASRKLLNVQGLPSPTEFIVPLYF